MTKQTRRNPVTEARKQVEAEVPPSRRGPGWDRHWRELEAYAAAEGEWPLTGEASPDKASPDKASPDKASPDAADES